MRSVHACLFILIFQTISISGEIKRIASFRNRGTGRSLASNINDNCFGLEENRGSSQRWLVHADDIEGIALQNQETQRCLDSNEAGHTYTHPCHFGSWQRWIYREGNLINKQTGLALDMDHEGGVKTMQLYTKGQQHYDHHVWDQIHEVNWKSDSSSHAKESSVFNIVVLGNTGVGKSSLMNMFAKADLFKVGHSAMSETQIAEAKECRLLGRNDGIRLRLIDTQGLADSGGDRKDMENIQNMVQRIRELEYIDLFIICFDGANPRFTAYAQSTLSLFSQMFGAKFLSHSVIVFNKWKTSDMEKRKRLQSEYQEKIYQDFGQKNIPCFFLDSNYWLKELRDTESGEQVESYLPPRVQERTESQVIQMGNLMNIRKQEIERCDVKQAQSVKTDKSKLEEQKRLAEAKLRLEQEENERRQREMERKQREKMDELERQRKAELWKLHDERLWIESGKCCERKGAFSCWGIGSCNINCCNCDIGCHPGKRLGPFAGDW